ncbi:MAG: type II toxin-antitoxin system HicA family toxin [Ekhidna sp.]|nr:type II toxin-antitoxin system HicA family toxin [Ekhidna sp.]
MSRHFRITGKKLVIKLQKMGFECVRVRGSHHRMKHPNGRITTIPLHGNKELSKGLIRKIIQEDLKMSIDDFQKK